VETIPSFCINNLNKISSRFQRNQDTLMKFNPIETSETTLNNDLITPLKYLGMTQNNTVDHRAQRLKTTRVLSDYSVFLQKETKFTPRDETESQM